MTLPLALLSYLVIWFISLFLLLPVRHWSWRRKLVLNTLLAAAITLSVHLLLLSGWIPLRDG